MNAPGMTLSGPGGVWELSGKGESLGASVRGAGFLLEGRMDPFGHGKRRTLGGAGALAGDVQWGGESGGPRWYAGASAVVSMLDVRDPLVIGAGGRVEPDTAVSMHLSLPAGALLTRRLAGGWRLDGQADASLQPGGATFFTYGPAGPGAYGATRRIHLDASAGARAGAAYEPWKLGLELLVRQSAGLGNNEPALWAAALLTLGAF